jgi:hypothetical protein
MANELVGEESTPSRRLSTAMPELIPLGPNAELNWISEQDSHGLGFNCWDAAEWAVRGWHRNWGDAAVVSPFFEMLRKEEDDGTWSFMILCPTFLRRPLEITGARSLEASY